MLKKWKRRRERLLPTLRLTFQPSFDAFDGGCGFLDGACSVFDPLDSSRLRSLDAVHDVFDTRIPFFVTIPKERHGFGVTRRLYRISGGVSVRIGHSGQD